ncbi:DUF1194 domain-containing protein [Pelagibius marinus]|uniref:DUF1194 domain-containing protein n=1 Tax=Pelagibius marinus TaxID=2762760 RepID=UPI0018726FAE|nr:DUF1194 domain-containing protein [Pelagibius marinus]
MVRIGGFLAALLLSALAPIQAPAQGSAAQARARIAVDLELVLAVDVSLSVDSEEAQLQRQGYVQAFRDPLVVDAIGGGILGRIAVTYFEWANSAHTQLIVDWTLIESPAAAERFAAALASRRPGPAHYTSISGAIDFGAALFKDNGFEGTRQVIDVSGDGPNNWGDLVIHARDRAVKKGITINGLPILDQSTGPFSRYNIPNLDLYYRDCVIGGPAAFIVVAEDFTAFASAIRRKLILEIAGLTPPPARPVPPLRPAQFIDDGDARISPPCDIGEQLLRSRNEDF